MGARQETARPHRVDVDLVDDRLDVATDVDAVNEAFGTSISVFTSADMNQNWAEIILLIATIGQLF